MTKSKVFLGCWAICMVIFGQSSAQQRGFEGLLDGIREVVTDESYSKAVQRPLFGTPVPVSFLPEVPLCGAEARFPSLETYKELTDRVFTRAESLASRVNTCSATCTLSINQAEVCNYRRQLNQETAWLKTAADAFLEGQSVFEAAATSGQNGLQALSNRLSLVSRASVDLLRRTIVAVEEDDLSISEDVDWNLLTRELENIGLVQLALDDFGLVSGSASLLGNTLVSAATEMRALRDDVTIALSRAAVLEPADAGALQDRALKHSVEIAWVTRSLHAAAHLQERSDALEPDTNANAVPTSSVNAAAIAACFADAGLASSVAAEGASMSNDIFSGCSPEISCADIAAYRTGFSEFLMEFDRAEKLVLAVRKSICRK